MCFGINDSMPTMKTSTTSKMKKNTSSSTSTSRTTKRPYVGLKAPNIRDMFMSAIKADTNTHPQYHTVKGPFKTSRGAKYLRDHQNPKAISALTVNELEALAKGMMGQTA